MSQRRVALILLSLSIICLVTTGRIPRGPRMDFAAVAPLASTIGAS